MDKFKSLFLILILFFSAVSEGSVIRDLANRYAEKAKRIDPFDAPFYGLSEGLDQFGDYPGPENRQRRKTLVNDTLKELSSLESSRGEDDHILFELLKDHLNILKQGFEIDLNFFEFSPLNNRLKNYLDMSSPSLTYYPFKTIENYAAFVKRADGFPKYVDRQIKALIEARAQKLVMSCAVAKRIPESYAEALKPKVEENPFWRPILAAPSSFSQEEKSRIQKLFRRMISDKIVPGYEKFDQFFKNEYLKSCRPSFGIGALPQGESLYRYFITEGTDLNLSPEEIHRIGLSEVKRIMKEFREVQAKLKIPGDYPQLLKALKGETFYFSNAEQSLAAFEEASAKVNKVLPTVFSEQPKTPLRIVESENPAVAGGSYSLPTDLTPYGRFILNTKNIKAVPKYEVMTLFLHEGSPGHHFQLAFNFERKEQLTEFQRWILNSNAFVEGWALYAEYLGREMGLFEDPLQKAGHLADELLRSVRLVVDTGIHAMGWSREKTLLYMQSHLPDDPKAIAVEADRYAAWPGQALGYKIGSLKIIELREAAQKKLGKTFDVRQFHKEVLKHGTVSLTVLEKSINDWIAKTSLQKAPK